MLTLKLKTTRIILINNINNLFQQLARQSTPCRAQGISCKCQQVYKSQKINIFKAMRYFRSAFCHGAAKLQQFFELGKKMIKKGFFWCRVYIV